MQDEREHRQRQLVQGYRIFDAYGWGDIGDGHISARDPERTDHFWLLGDTPFGQAALDDLVLVGPDGEAQGGRYNRTAYNIHWPIHEARPDTVAAAHTHTHYGTPWSANARLFRPITQEACAFFDDHSLFDDEEVNVRSTDGGKRIAVALEDNKAIILRNHGLLTVGGSVAEAVAWFVMMERTAEAHVKAPEAQPISDEAAARAYETVGNDRVGERIFDWLVRRLGL